jgi:hypothetical protein
MEFLGHSNDGLSPKLFDLPVSPLVWDGKDAHGKQCTAKISGLLGMLHDSDTPAYGGPPPMPDVVEPVPGGPTSV